MEIPSARPDFAGKEGAARKVDQLFPELYSDLRRLAHAHRRRHAGHETMSTTALVNEVYMRLHQAGRLATEDRLYFLALSARTMRFVLIDYARRSSAAKRGPGASVTGAGDAVATELAADAETLLAVHAALERLSAMHERMAQIVECRFFGGMTEEEIAQLLGISERTVRGDWQRAKIWLAGYLDAATP